jgi:hypothetical protein
MSDHITKFVIDEREEIKKENIFYVGNVKLGNPTGRPDWILMRVGNLEGETKDLLFPIDLLLVVHHSIEQFARGEKITGEQ